MADTPERKQEIPQNVTPEYGVQQPVAPEQATQPESYLEKLEQAGVQVRPDDFQTPVVNDDGQVLTTPVPSDVKTITVPTHQEQLLEWAKGPIENSLTWRSRFFIRMIKKAILRHWHLIMPPSPVQQPEGAQIITPQAQQIHDPLHNDQIDQGNSNLTGGTP